MRTAILICGQLRTFFEVWENMKKNVVDVHDCDIFIHTWTKTGYGRRANHLDIIEKEVTEKELYELTNAKKVIVEDFKDEYQTQLLDVKIPQGLIELEPIHHRNNLALFYTLYKTNELKKEYEIENNFKYDRVIKTRPDIDFKVNIPKEVFNYPNHLMQWSFRINPQTQVCDKLAIGSSEIMDYYTSVFENLNEYYLDLGIDKKTRPVGERLMFRHMRKSNYPIGSFVMDAYIKHVSFLNENENKTL